MLCFSTKPDKIFTEILTASLEIAMYKLENFGEKYLGDILPNASRVFDVETAIRTIKRLIFCIEKPGVYGINDYHFVLIYDVLDSYCELFNEADSVIVEGTKITKVDFDSLISLYFHDVDFFTPKEKVLDPAFINFMNYTLETLGVILGLEPSPRDLEVRLLQEREYTFVEEEEPLYGPESMVYPDLSIGEEERKGH